MKKHFILTCALLAATLVSWGQRTPLHPLDIKEGSTDLYAILESWNPGSPPADTDQYDDQFYISRVRPLLRIADDDDYSAEVGADPKRKMCLWVPMDDPSTKWKSLPRYCFEGDNFGMWSYIDIHGNWTGPWMRVTAGITDVAHKNGVKVGALNSIRFGVNVYPSEYSQTGGKTFYRLFQKNLDGTFKHATKLVKLMKYYGIDGLGVNSEFRTNFMPTLIEFIKTCKAEAKKIDWEFQWYWYDGTNDNGNITFDRGLGAHNDGIFGDGTAPVTDMLFFNYNWSTNILNTAHTKATEMGRSSYDVYAGYDIQGGGVKNTWRSGTGFVQNAGWEALKNSKISIGFWGAHAQSLLHQSATDDGASDLAIQKAYLQKQELLFSGGNRNPVVTPPIYDNASLGNADLKKFHGIAALKTAKSTIQQVPFVSRFSLGNGRFFNNEGKTTFNHKWYNISTQDFLPTWRWWITDQTDAVTQEGLAGLIKADFTFDDAWFGGSCLKLHGATTFSRVKLFKTKLDVQPDYTLSVTYKVLNGTDPKAKIFVAKKGALTTYLTASLPAGEQGKWKTHTFALSELGLTTNDVVSLIGITCEGTTPDYELLLGELAVRNPARTFAPVTPTITKVDVLRRRYNEVDFKLFYKSRDEADGVKTYNDEVDTWYFEIYMEQKGQPQQLLTATTSWAGYVVDAPWVYNGLTEARFGVRAVSPDGKQASPIAWSEFREVPYDTPQHEPVMDKPVVKPNETFTISYKDLLHTPARKWEIKDPFTNAVLAEAENATKITAQIDRVGLFDLHITDAAGQLVVTRGFVQITPEATGAVPTISSWQADKRTAETDQPIVYSYTSRDGEGSVSRALRISDPDMFMVPADAQQGMEYSYAVWFKVDKFSHDKQGTNLINKNTVADKWPHNNWGDLWVTIRPNSEVSFNTFGWTEHDVPSARMKSTDHFVTPGVWHHLVVTQTADKLQKMYFNGKKVAEFTFPSSSRREHSTDDRIDQTAKANIFFGGGGVYKAGFDGWIDEVQIWNKALTEAEVLEAMRGYATPPAGLTAYYTFEAINNDPTGAHFENQVTTNPDFKGKVVKMAASGGENTSSASYEPVPFSNDELGYPGITGSLPITTTAEWNLPGSETTTATPASKQIQVVYKTAGNYDAGLKLTNRWGSAEDLKTEYVTISRLAGLDHAEAYRLSIYPNPFVESINMTFAEAGAYTVRVLNPAGQLLSESKLHVEFEAQVVNVTVDGEPGTYMLQVLKNNQLYRTLKLIKQ